VILKPDGPHEQARALTSLRSRRWGRLGKAGKTRVGEHLGEGEALAALQALQSAKRKKDYQRMIPNTYEPG
jgi:predicted DNA-binding WGR domain protein